MEDESVWWFGAYLAIPMSFAAFMFRVLEVFQEQMAEAAGTGTATPATPESSFAIEQFPQELLTGTRVMTWLLLAYAVLGMAASLYLDSRWVAINSEDWRPTPQLYAAVGLVPGVSSVVALYYLAKRYDSVGIARINAPEPPSLTDARSARWWVLLLGSAVVTQVAVTAILVVRWLEIMPGGLVYFITGYTVATIVITVFQATGLLALVVDAKRLEAAGAWKPHTAVYAAVMFFLPVTVLPVTLIYIYKRWKKIGF